MIEILYSLFIYFVGLSNGICLRDCANKQFIILKKIHFLPLIWIFIYANLLVTGLLDLW